MQRTRAEVLPGVGVVGEGEDEEDDEAGEVEAEEVLRRRQQAVG